MKVLLLGIKPSINPIWPPCDVTTMAMLSFCSASLTGIATKINLIIYNCPDYCYFYFSNENVSFMSRCPLYTGLNYMLKSMNEENEIVLNRQ